MASKAVSCVFLLAAMLAMTTSGLCTTLESRNFQVDVADGLHDERQAYAKGAGAILGLKQLKKDIVRQGFSQGQGQGSQSQPGETGGEVITEGIKEGTKLVVKIVKRIKKLRKMKKKIKKLCKNIDSICGEADDEEDEDSASEETSACDLFSRLCALT